MNYIDKVESLSAFQRYVINDQGTEYPNTGKYTVNEQQGTYLCRRCGLALFRSIDKFKSTCGWPSFDQQIKTSVEEYPDNDGRRIEIACTRCRAHLGHVFRGEELTARNLRYCVNSTSIDFVASHTIYDSEEVILAGGCFWGVEHLMKNVPGVVLAECGYIGGQLDEPSYTKVCEGNTGHYEAVRVVYDTNITTLNDVLKYFLEIHDPQQVSGQGPDLGTQYRSAIFVYNHIQASIATTLLGQLREKGMVPATKVLPVSTFWAAEEEHQSYYVKHKKVPYCHVRVQRFDDE